MSAPSDVRFPNSGAPRTLGELLTRRANERGGDTAYTFLADGDAEELTVSYHDLELQARAIAALLLRNELAGERALLMYPPGLDFIAAFFGCLYAGTVAVPVYPPEPGRVKRTDDRLAMIAADSEAKAALTTRLVLSGLQQMPDQAPQVRILSCLATDGCPDDPGDHLPAANASGDSIAFLQYTSGSTDKPKGVVLTHSNLLHNAAVVRELCEHGAEDKYVSWLPAFHDMGFMAGVLQPLYSGVAAVLLSPAAFLERPIRWLKAISRFRATTSGGPNFAYDLCVRKTSPEERASLDLSSWTIAFNGSEPVRWDTLQRFAEAFAGCGFRKESFYPCYGLAEATLIVSGGPKQRGPVTKAVNAPALGKGSIVEGGADQGPQRVLVSSGRISRHQRVEVVQAETGIRCLPGEIGEIWISGPSVGQGYWGKPKESQQTFRCAIVDTGSEPFLRTGDLGFVDDQNLYITGRLKDLIIIRGVNYYPQDIESAVSKSHPALRPGCGAAFSIDQEGGERLVVVQEVDDRQQSDLDHIIAAIRQSVSETDQLQVYAVVLVKRGAIPKTSSGKIRRNACRTAFLENKLEEVRRSTQNERQDASGAGSFVRKAFLAIAPEVRRPVVESYLLERLTRALRTSSSDLLPDQRLSALGLDSLLAMELSGELEHELGTSIPASRILAGASVREIASVILDQLGGPVPSLPDLSTVGESAPTTYPLAFTQKAFWFFYQLAPESGAYNTAFAISIRPRMDVAVLARALQRLVDRHACLRTTFGIRDGQPVQHVHPHLRSSIREAPASALLEEELRRAIADDAYGPFDLERGPVHRATLFTTSSDEQILLLTVHHIVVDGWSFWLLLNELIELYRAEKTGDAVMLPGSTTQYSDYVNWQGEMVDREEGERHFQYWKQELSGDLPVLDLPTAHTRPPLQTYSGSSYAFGLDAQMVTGLRRLASAHDVTLFMVILALFQILLHRHSGQDDILVGAPISARPRTEFTDIVGCFFNPAVLRADFSVDMKFTDFLRQVRNKVLGALDHQDYPCHILVERLQPVRDPARPPLFQATLILHKPQTGARVPISFGDVRFPMSATDPVLSFVPVERRHARIELELEMIESGGILHSWLHYNQDLFDAPSIARMAGHFQVLVCGALADPSQRLSELPLLTSEEIRCLMAEEAMEEDPSVYAGIDELFAEAAERAPEKIAAVYKDSAMTFEELNRRSDRLADLIGGLTN